MTIHFTEATLATGGGKAANLGSLQRAGLPVPDGFVIDADSYRRVISGLDVAALLLQGPDAVRAAVEAQPVPADLERQIRDRLANWGELEPVAVRSSATAEDLPDASFAGQQDTFLGVVGAEAVLAAVRRCWGSLWTARAFDYRQRNGFEHTHVALAVVVQRLVDADTAGVLFTQDPVTGADEMLIDASWGLGESVVSGAVTPDEYRATAEVVLGRRTGDKQTRIDREGTSTRTSTVPTADRDRLCLEDVQVIELARLGRAVHDHFGMPMDIEWAYADERVWLLQARPITTHVTASDTLAPVTTTVSGHRIGKASRTFHDDLVEHYPGPYPLDLAAIIPMHQALQSAMASVGLRATPVKQLITMAADGTLMAAYPDVHADWRVARILRRRSVDPANWPAIERAFKDQLASALPAELTQLPDSELPRLLEEVLDIVSNIARVRFLDYVGPAQITGAILGGYLTLADRRDLDAYDLLGELDFVTAVIDRELHRLAQIDPNDFGYASAYQQFLHQHGARTPQLYLPFSHRSWREDPASLDVTIDAIRRGAPRTGPDYTHAGLIAQITGRLPAPARKEFTRTVARWRAFHIAREASVYLIEEAYVLARRVVEEVAARLWDRGVLTDPDDIKYLTPDETFTALKRQLPAAEVRRIVKTRAEARPRAANVWWLRAETSSHSSLTGAAGSPGAASGPARIITGPEDFDRLQARDILVCRYTDPSWTPLFSLAAGVVADTGGRLSHAAIVAREYRIPAVMGAAGATTSIRDGELITVDGTNGTVIRQNEHTRSGRR